MARLRKASPLEPSAFLQQPVQVRPSRSSPRKAVREVSYIVSSDEDEENVPLRPKPSKRGLGESSSIFQDSLYTSKSYISPSVLTLTPRKQRILRPVENNSRLLRKMSDDSLASPEKRPGSERRARRRRSGTQEADLDIGRRRNLMYSKSLARSIAGRELKKQTPRIDVLDDTEMLSAQEGRKNNESISVEVTEIAPEPEDETSILCGDEEDVVREAKEQQVELGKIEESSFEDDDDDDDEIALPTRPRQRPLQRRVISDTESEYEEEAAAKEEELVRQQKESEEPGLLMSIRSPRCKKHSITSNWVQEVIDLTDSPEALESFILPASTRARSSSFAVSRSATSPSDLHPYLTYSPTPTKKCSPCKAPPISRPRTPPLAHPGSTKLVSPSKKKPLMPKAPDLRPSLDAFWNPEVVNEWNDRHLYAKPLVSPKKQQWRDDITKVMGGMDLQGPSSSDEAYVNPSTSPKKKHSQSLPTKKDSRDSSTPTLKEIRAQKKEFAERKHDIAISFLAELDSKICSGTISKLSSTTGGIKLIWSKTLKTTAGRANWRREVIRLRTSSEPLTYTTEIRHHCSIELASKVIDDEERLYNVLAHEFCHLTTFMISEVRGNPHGTEFKAWGRKASNAFADRGVEVTTKHSYAIEYKYVWECVSCGYEFKRHSKSVDIKRHSCGKCKGTLVQTKPAPRGTGVGKDGEKIVKKSEYQMFVKANFAKTKGEMAASGLDTQMGKVMEVVARQYREKKEKEKERKEGDNVLDELDEALDGLKL